MSSGWVSEPEESKPHIVDPQITTRAYKLFELNIAHYLITIIGAFTQPNWWVLKCRNSFQVLLLRTARAHLSRSPKKQHRKSTPNESVKIPIRIKKLYNHNVSPHRTSGEVSKRNIEKTLKAKRRRNDDEIKGVCRPSELFRYIYYRHHKIIIYYTMFLLCCDRCCAFFVDVGLSRRRSKCEARVCAARALCVMQNDEPFNSDIAPVCLPKRKTRKRGEATLIAPMLTHYQRSLWTAIFGDLIVGDGSRCGAMQSEVERRFILLHWCPFQRFNLAGKN